MTKKKQNKKFSFKKLISFIIILILIGLFIYYLFNVKTKNILIINNTYYNDDELIEACKLEDYPKFLTLNTSKIKKTLESFDLIKEAKVKRKWGFVLQIELVENKVLYYIRSKDEYMLSDNKTYKLDNIVGVPTLINYVPESIEASFVKGFNKVDRNIISLVSEIEYTKTTFDEKRFLLYMNDGNLVYITVSKTDVLNKYLNIVKKLNNKKGILYLDSGNYFEIKN